MTTHFKRDLKPNETRSETADCKTIARINGFRRAAQLAVTDDADLVTCKRCLRNVAFMQAGMAIQVFGVEVQS